MNTNSNMTGLTTIRKALDSWKVLIADDEQIVHDVTSLALKTFVFANKPISFYHAYSGDEARQMLEKNPDIAVILLDVVMETDDAGLQTARYIREKMNNKLIRIIIHTGLPDAAPEEATMREYDINDYKSKGDLTIQQLKTTMYASLRMYRDLVFLDQQHSIMQRVINSTSNLLDSAQLKELITDIRAQISSEIKSLSKHMVDSSDHTFLLAGCNKRLSGCLAQVLAGNGRFADVSGQRIDQVLDEQDLEIMKIAVHKKQTLVENNKAVFISANKQGDYGLIYFAELENCYSLNIDLMEVFSRNISIAYNNFCYQYA